MKLKFCTLGLLSLFALRAWTQRPAGGAKPDRGAAMPEKGAAMLTGDSIGQAVIRAKCTKRFVELPWRRRSPKYPTLFRGIRVLDYRRDTSRIGMVHSGAYSQAQILFFEGNAESAFGASLESVYASPEGADSLLVLIKDLWISDSLDRSEYTHGFFADRHWWRVAFRFEAYLQHDGGFVPLTYLDTLAEVNGNQNEITADRRLWELSEAFMEKVSAMDVPGTVGRKRTVTMAQIDSFSNRRFDYAMDTALRPVKGVYANVEEFRNNSPSVSDYQITVDQQGNRELRVRGADGQLYYSHTLWGFCDGLQSYIMMDGNLFPVFLVHHQFYVLGSDLYKQKNLAIPFILPIGPAAFLYGAVDVKSAISRKLQIFRLDAESGKVAK